MKTYIILQATELLDTTVGRVAEYGIITLILCMGLYFMFDYFKKKEKFYLEKIAEKDAQINSIIEKTIENQTITNETLEKIKQDVKQSN